MAEEYLGIKDAAKYLKVSISTLRRWEKKGLITPMRTAGNRRRYTVRQLDDMLGLNTQKELGAVARRGLVIAACHLQAKRPTLRDRLRSLPTTAKSRAISFGSSRTLAPE